MTLPESFKKSLRAWRKGEWFRIGLDEHVGGLPAPAMVAWAINEFVLGANPAVFIMAGPEFAGILDALGTEQQRHWRRCHRPHWGATMVLTEPGAGSDVGADAPRRSSPTVPGSRASSGSSPTATSNPENIVHMVLARPEGAGPGTKGLSLFIVPKYWVEADGELGERNGAVVTRSSTRWASRPRRRAS